MDVRFGPFESVATAYQNVGPNGLDAIYAGLIFCVISSGNVEFYKWTKTNNPTVNDVEKVIPTFKTVDGKAIVGEGNISTNGIIPFAGVKESGTVLSGTSSNTAEYAQVYYYTTPGVFGYSTNGGTSYYKHWANEGDFGNYEIFDANYTSGNYAGNLQGVIPFNNRLYLDCSTFEIKGGTDNENFDNIDSNPLELTEAQLDALNSGVNKNVINVINSLIDAGITVADITELKRIKAMNIQFNAGTDKLTLTGKVSGTDTTKTYPLSTGGGSADVTTYGVPTLSISYPTISASGGTYNPNISISQKVYVNDAEDHTNTYTTLNDFLLAGGSIQFSWTNTSNRFDSLDAENGAIGADENLSGNNKIADVTISVTINNKTASDSITATQTTTSKLYIKSISYTTTNSNGTYTATPTITASDNQEYSVSEYNELSVETFSFSCNINGVINSSTGVITYNPSTLISNIAAGSALGSMLIDVNQENTEHNIGEIVYEWIDNTGITAAVTMSGIRGSNSGGKIYKPGSQSYGKATATITGVTAGDTYVIETNAEEGIHLHIWETKSKLVNDSNGTGTIANSSMWTTNAATNYNTFVSSVGGKETVIYVGSGKRAVYKVKGDVTDLTFSVFRAYATDTISYKKLN